MARFTFHSIGVPGQTYTDISVNGVDTAGEIVGNFGDSVDGASYGFFDNGAAQPFNPPNSSYTEVVGVTPADEIYGFYSNSAGERGFPGVPKI